MDWLDPQTEFPKNRPGQWLVILAVILFLHYLLARVSSEFIGSHEEANNQAPIELTAPPDNSHLPEAQTAIAKKQKDTQDPAHFLGEFRNRVEKETRALRQGRFHQANPSGAPEPLGPNGEKTPGLAMKDLLPFGADDQVLDEVEKGRETVLNTDPYVYASFFNRLKDAVYDPWIRHVQDAMGQRGAALKPAEYLTGLAVELNKNGDITSITIVKSCGIRELDRAAEAAFWEIKQFPNPPNGLIQKDGFVHFNFGFVLDTQSRFNILRL